METRYLKVCQEWNFAGLKIELQPSETDSYPPYYKIYDRHYLEVSCLHFWVFEIVEGKNVLNNFIKRIVLSVHSPILLTQSVIDESLFC